MQNALYILLADDDEDDCAFFKEALDELLLSVSLVTVNDGVQLMDFLSDNPLKRLPDILFLDLNMPRKSGFECLAEIKEIDKLKHKAKELRILKSKEINSKIQEIKKTEIK